MSYIYIYIYVVPMKIEIKQFPASRIRHLPQNCAKNHKALIIAIVFRFCVDSTDGFENIRFLFLSLYRCISLKTAGSNIFCGEKLK